MMPKTNNPTPETTETAPEIARDTSPQAAEAAVVAAESPDHLPDFNHPAEPRGKAGSAPDQASAFDQDVANRVMPAYVGDIPETADNPIEAELRQMAAAGHSSPAIMQRREELLRKLAE